MSTDLLLKEVEDCLSFAIKQSDITGMVQISTARARTLLADLRSRRKNEKVAKRSLRKEPAWLTNPE